jgi:long-chain acyl-CoA synthetase
MAKKSGEKLLLQRVYGHEKNRADALYMTQPMGDDRLERFSWARTMDEARRMAAYLRAQNFPPRSQIALVSKNCAHFLMTDLAIWMAGHVSVALYPTLNAETVKYILEHSESKMLFVGKLDEWDEMKAGVPEGMPLVSYPLSPKNDYPTWNKIIKEHEPIEDSPTPKGDDMALIIYTSGSTGRPKGVMHSFHGISVATNGIIDALGITSEDRMLSYLPLAHAFERWLVGSVSLAAGFEVFFAESLDTFVADLRRASPTLFISVPRLWLKFQHGVFKKMPPDRLRLLLKIPIVSGIIRKKVLTGLGLQHVRFAGSGSAPIPGELISWYRDLGLELLEGYGMSENFSYSHISMPGRTRVGYVGETYPGVDCKISAEGEILVKSPANMMGYFKEPEMSTESFDADGYLKTGDRGELDDQGRLKITGRVKELFKTSKGKYIAPVPIENLINSDRHIELCCVSGSGQPQPYAVVQLAEDLRAQLDAGGDKAEVESALKSLLAKVNGEVEQYEQLDFIAVAKKTWSIEDGFLTPTMKIKRARIEEEYNPQLESWYGARKKVVWE